MVNAADTVVIHNSAFDRTVLREHGVHIPVEKIHDTMVQALMHSLPGSLDMLCDLLGVPVDKAKDKDGKRLIQLFTKPLAKNRKLDRATAQTHPTEWARFIEYARRDVEAMRDILPKLPKWNFREPEIRLWRLDQKINDRGVCIDLELAHAAQAAAARAMTLLAEDAAAATDGALTSTTQRGKTLQLLRDMGVNIPDLRAGTIEFKLEDPTLPPAARELLEIRAQASATSPSKYGVLVNATSSDGRLRGTLQFAGASRTSRWCLAEGALVLVKDDTGRVYEKAIERVDLEDRVWDGEAWVRHRGVVFSGEKDVIEHDGVCATPQHEVYVSPTEHLTLAEAKARGAILWKGNGTQFTG
jgi:DNA polymerase